MAGPNGKLALQDAARLRHDHVYDLLIRNFSGESTSTAESCITPQIVYHRSCYQTYTSKRNISFVKLEEKGTKRLLSSTDHSEMSDNISQTMSLLWIFSA